MSRQNDMDGRSKVKTSDENLMENGRNGLTSLFLTGLWQKVESDNQSFVTNHPFPHILIENFLKTEQAEKSLDSFPVNTRDQWIHYLHYNEKKFGLNKYDLLPPQIQQVVTDLHSQEFLSYLSALTGIDNLLADRTLEGGGLHLSERGGFLNVHTDFTVHPHRSDWERRLNLIIYLNKDWELSFKGDLELWTKDMSKCEKTIAPLFNNCIIFATDSNSYHGFPDPILCPPDMTRKSIALYYYTRNDRKVRIRSTNYRARPGDGIRSVWIWADKQLVNIYTWLKKNLGLKDDFASRLLRFLSGRK